MTTGTFRYTARTLDGELVRGSMRAADVSGVLDLLRSRALCVTAVIPEGRAADRLRRALRVGGVSQTGLLAFFRSFVTLIRAGVSIGRALTVTIERADDLVLREALLSVLADVELGAALSDAMSRRPHEFPPLYVAMIRAGETGGILDDVLERLALLLERESALRKKVRSALAYPAIVLSAALALVVFLLTSIVPMFAQIFASFHVELPPATQALLSVSGLLATPLPWTIMAAALSVGALAVYRALRTSGAVVLLDGVRLRVPIVGPLLRKAIMARVARMLATLLRAGIELVGAIDAVIPVTNSPSYARAFANVNVALREGEALAGPLAESGLFDPLFLALVRVGEETGLLDEMLLTIAQYFETDVDAAVATLGALIEPVLIILLGGVVGFIVFSIFLPLYALAGNVSK